MGTSYQSTDLVSLGKSAHLMDEEREREIGRGETWKSERESEREEKRERMLGRLAH